MDGFTPWPKEFADRYRAEGYWRGQTLAKVRQIITRADPDFVEEWKWVGTW